MGIGQLLIRADASVRMGTGHLMRCLALAQAWQSRGGKVSFALAIQVPALEKRLIETGMDIIYLSSPPGSQADAMETSQIAQTKWADWVVLDGYHFDADYQRMLKQAGGCLLCLDDYGHAAHYYADLLLNQNIYAHKTLYPNKEVHTSLLLGLSYVILRQEFWCWQGWQRQVRPVGSNVLVTLGGSDPDNVSLRVIQALQKHPHPLDIIVLVGGSNPHYERLNQVVQQSNASIRLERNVTNMSKLLAWADLAIAAGGTTSWELAFMGVPSLLLILADNQRAIAEHLEASGVAVNLGWADTYAQAVLIDAITTLLKSYERRVSMSRRGQDLIDGQGVIRVLDIMESWDQKPEIKTTCG